MPVDCFPETGGSNPDLSPEIGVEGYFFLKICHLPDPLIRKMISTMIGQYPGALFNPWYVDKLFEILVIFLIDEPRQVGPVGVYRTTQIFEGDCQVLSPCQEFPENIVSGVKNVFGYLLYSGTAWM